MKIDESIGGSAQPTRPETNTRTGNRTGRRDWLLERVYKGQGRSFYGDPTQGRKENIFEYRTEIEDLVSVRS